MTDAVTSFLDSYGLANTSGVKHGRRKQALALARAAHSLAVSVAPAGIEIRATHWAGFRSGEWAVVTGIEWANERPCYIVRFPDGATDSWVVTDPWEVYEFRVAEVPA